MSLTKFSKRFNSPIFNRSHGSVSLIQVYLSSIFEYVFAH
jgi:hypothetical protein